MPSPRKPEVAARQIIEAQSQARAIVSAPGQSADLPPVKFDRLSVERRVLGFVTDEIDYDPIGPRNTLAALTHALINDPNTTHPPPPAPRLERLSGDERVGVEGLSLIEAAEVIAEHLNRLVAAGLVAERGDGSYRVTKAGQTELKS